MRRVVVWLGMAALCFVSSTARAQAPAPSVLPPGVPHASPAHVSQAGPDGRIRRQATQSEQFIFERATEKARQRDFRMESKKWAGYSPLRPAVNHGHYSNDLNRYLWGPTGFYYANGIYPGSPY